MNYKLQLASFLFSFLYGMFFYITNVFNNKLINKKKLIFKYIITVLYIINIILLYIVGIYKVNQGFFHIYFLFMVLIGYIFGYLNLKKVKIMSSYKKSIFTKRKK